MSMKQNLNNPDNAVHIYGINEEGTVVDLQLSLPQFVDYMNALTVEDFKDFTKLNINFNKPFTIHQQHEALNLESNGVSL